MKCPKCKRFARELRDDEKLKYIGTYQNGIPNSTAFECYWGCWVYCKKCGMVDP